MKFGKVPIAQLKYIHTYSAVSKKQLNHTDTYRDRIFMYKCRCTCFEYIHLLKLTQDETES